MSAPDGVPEDGSVVGTWQLSIRTPIGRQEAELVFARATGAQELTGTARGKGETVALSHVVQDGPRVSWDQSITRPMRLNLHFDVTVTGDRMQGTSKAGRLPTSEVTGQRRGPVTDSGSSSPG